MPAITQVDIDASSLERLKPLLDGDYARFERRMREVANLLDGRTVWNVNSTAEGGGVAEMLAMLLPYALDAGWDVRWAVMSGDDEFFDVTKGIHNALHGVLPADEAIWNDGRTVYERTIEQNAAELTQIVGAGDVVLIHDPQAAGLIAPLIDVGAAVAWQCHVGTDDANEHTRRAWDFLRAYVERADRYVFTREAYLWEGLRPERLRVIPPSIDALSVKNAPLDEAQVDRILTAAGITEGSPDAATFSRSDGSEGTVERRVVRSGSERPIPHDARVVLEVSRWDRLKDPIGFIRMYDEHFSDRPDVHLVYAGPATNGVDDDPEGTGVAQACAGLWRSLRTSVQERVHLFQVPMDDVEENAVIVNALQRRADVVVQKSLEEGFGLTVSEAMWKTRPVVASRVGGIQDQIEHGRSGVLVDDPYDLGGFAREVASLLDDPKRAKRLGESAQRRVREHFLNHRQLLQYADLMVELIDEDARATA